MRIAISAALLAASFILFGCNAEPADAEAQKSTASKVKEFKGSVESKIVGAWKPEKGTVILTLNKDGTCLSEGKVPMGKGTMNVHTVGQWAVNGDELLMKSGKDAEHLADPVAYRWKLDGDKLVMQLGASGPTTTYHRASGGK